MFQLARADAGRMVLQEHSFYLDELLGETARAARILGCPRDISVNLPPLPESLCYGDEDLLRQLVSNLLDNAIRFTPNGGTVSIDLQRSNGTYRVSVADTGPGIPSEAQERIFERFFRIEKDRGRRADGSGSGSGAGLGLAIAKTIAEAHGGRLWLSRSDATGTTFAFTVPSRTPTAHAGS